MSVLQANIIEEGRQFLLILRALENESLRITGMEHVQTIRRGNIYDHYIQGWTQYWNDVLKPFESLDPDIVKALIASESSFNPKAWNKRQGPQRARGLTQITDQTLRYLSDDYSELRDHYLTLSEDDMLDPNLSICAGIRWLFRKKGLAEAKLKRKVTWTEAIAEYKGVNPTGKSSRDCRVMRTFDRYLAELKGKK